MSLRSPSLFWTLAGSFLLVLLSATILQGVVIVAIVHPILSSSQASRAELEAIGAATQIGAIYAQYSDPELRKRIAAVLAADPSEREAFHLRYEDEAGWTAGVFERRPHRRSAADSGGNHSGRRPSLREIARVPVVVDGREVGAVVALGPRHRLRLWPQTLHVLLALPVSLLLSGVGGFIIFRLLLRRIGRLEAHSRRVSDGDLDARISDPGADEIGRLGSSLNEMTARLKAARDSLDASDRQRRQLFADITHELATPLTSIRGFAETLGNPEVEVSAEEQGRYLLHVQEEADRMASLLDELLELTRLEAGAVEFERERVDLAALCRNTLERFEARARAAEMEFRGVGLERELWLLADGRRLERVVDNFLGNAIRYAGGAGVITLRLVEANGSVVLSVEDEGPGFPADALTQVFDRFYRGDAARMRGGTGLGLAIVKEIVRRHGGEVGAENLDAGGARVWARLPLAEA